MWIRLWVTIDRWAPALISLLSLSTLLVAASYYSSRVSFLEGQLVTMQKHQESQFLYNSEEREKIRNEVSGLRNWAIAVYERTSQAGIVIPPVPVKEKR